MNDTENDLVPDDPEIENLPDTPGPGAWQWSKEEQKWIPIPQE